MIQAKSMEVRDNFKKWCGEASNGEIVRIVRPGNNCVYMISQEIYNSLAMGKRIATYTTYLKGKDKITNLKRLSEIEKLPDNWNNNGAERISNGIVRSVRKLLVCLEYQPEVFPTACDAIQLEWENEKNEYLEMEILENSVNVFQIDADGNEQQSTIPFDQACINEIVRGFYDRAV